MSFFSGYTPDVVSDRVKQAISGFDNTVDSVSNLMSFNLKGGEFSSFWNAVKDVSTGIEVVAISLAIIYTYIAITKEGISLKGDLKKMLTILLRLVITKGLIDSATDFMYWIYSIGATVTKIVNSKIGSGNESLKDIFNSVEFAKGLGITDKSSGFDCFVATQYANVISFFLWGLGIALIIIAISRVFKVYLQIMLSSLAFAKLPLEGYNGIKDTISSFFGTSLQGAVIIGATGLFKMGVAHSDSISNIFKGQMFGSFGVIVVFAISLVLVIFQSESIAKKFA